MIFTAVDRRRVDYGHLSENDTVVAVNHDFAAILKTILQVLPDTKTVAIVNGVLAERSILARRDTAATGSFCEQGRIEMVR